MRSPNSRNWSIDELKLALELYLSTGTKNVNKLRPKSPKIITLSKILRSLDTAPSVIDEKYRNENSVRLKLMNFYSIDQNYPGKSMSNGGRGDREVWNKYHNNLEQLRKEVLNLLNTKLVGRISSDVKKYIEDIEKNISDESANNETVDRFVSSALSVSEYLRFIIGKQENSEHKTKLLQLCDEIDNTLKVYSIEKVDESEKIPDKQQGGVNLKPFYDNNFSPSKHVRSIIETLIGKDVFTDELLSQMTDSAWSKQVLGLDYPLIKPFKTKKRNKFEYFLQYYKRPYEIAGVQYVLCKEWNRSSSTKFDGWVYDLYESKRIDLSESQLKKLLNILKDLDSKNVFIDIGEISNIVKCDITKPLEKMLEIGLLSYYQRNQTKYIVEDYDLLFDMIENTGLYSR